MDSGNNSGSLQSSSGGDEEFDSRTFFATNINASATSANSKGFSISNAAAAAATTNNFPFLDNFSFLAPASPFPLLDPKGPDGDNPTPARTTAPVSTLSSPRGTSSKKRTRASRRAPTTVLTTDTSNFRAMVQEFTGIPAPPFASSSSSSASPYPPPRSRFDFFNHNPALNAGGGGGPVAVAGASPSPSFFLKPYVYPQKPFHFPITNATTATNTNSIINYHHLPPPPPPPPPSNFGLTNSHWPLQSQMMPSTSTAAPGYGSVGDLGQLTGAIGPGWGQDAAADPTSLLRQVSNDTCKFNYSAMAAAAAATAEFGAEKGGEARGEGMVESWICSSD